MDFTIMMHYQGETLISDAIEPVNEGLDTVNALNKRFYDLANKLAQEDEEFTIRRKHGGNPKWEIKTKSDFQAFLRDIAQEEMELGGVLSKEYFEGWSVKRGRDFYTFAHTDEADLFETCLYISGLKI